MAAIWGIVKTTPGGDIDFNSVQTNMKSCMSTYIIDRLDSVLTDTVYFSCAHQYFTKEAIGDVLPITNDEKTVFFTGDCILDNREELIRILNTDSLPDGQLAYQAYLKWGEEFVSHLRGVFSFAVYDQSKDVFLLYTDHTSCRSINYRYTGGRIEFSTTYDLFTKGIPAYKPALSEKWLVGCEAEPSACMVLFPGLTPYEDVFQVTAGSYVKISNNLVRIIQYWDPRKTDMLRLAENNSYKDLFVQTFTACVTDLLRENVKIAANLSGGLDSTSVVSIAAPVLEKRGETLYTYTSVPEFKDKHQSSDYYIEDESPAVLRTVSCFPNIECDFLSCQGQSPYTRLKELVYEYGFPMKSAINMIWLKEVSAKARQKGCTIMLSGQHGNSTISYGNIFSLAWEQVLGFHLIRARRNIREFLHKNRVLKKSFLDYFKREIKGYSLIFLPCKPYIDFEQSLIQQKLYKFYRIPYISRKRDQKIGNGIIASKKQKKNIPFQIDELQQLGLYNTMDSLVNGIIERDPTRDKRMIELCISLPMEQYVQQGIERYLVRGYLDEVVPEHIRMDLRHRGLQGADYIDRINNCWKKEQSDILDALYNTELKKYVDHEKLEEMINKCKSTEHFCSEDGIFLINLSYILAFSYFLADNVTVHTST